MTEMEEMFASLMEDTDKKKPALTLADVVKVVRHYWEALWSKKYVILVCGLLGGALGLLYAFNKKVEYTAAYSFSLGSSSSNSGMGGLTAFLGIGDNSMGMFAGDNVVELFKSRSIMEKTLLTPFCYEGDTITMIEYCLLVDSVRVKCEEEKLKEKKADEEERITVCDLYFPVGQERDSFSREQDSVLIAYAGALLKNVQVSKRDKKLSYVDYQFKAGDEQFAKEFASVHLQTVSDFYVDTKTSLSRKNIDSFQDRADSVRNALNKALTMRAVYADENRNAIRQVVSVNLLKIETDIRMYSATYEEMVKNIEMLKLDLARETPLIQMVDYPVCPLPNNKFRKLYGIAIGGFLGGFFSCLGIILLQFIKDKKEELAGQLVPVNESEGDKNEG